MAIQLKWKSRGSMCPDVDFHNLLDSQCLDHTWQHLSMMEVFAQSGCAFSEQGLSLLRCLRQAGLQCLQVFPFIRSKQRRLGNYAS